MTNEIDANEIDAALSALDKLLRIKDQDGNVVLQVALLATVYFEDAY